MKRSRNLGEFRARGCSAHFGYAGSLLHVEVDIDLVDEDKAPPELFGRDLKWRGGYSPGASERTLRALHAMGATFPGDDPLELTGVGSRFFLVELIAVECDLEETHGKEGVHRVFVHAVKPLQETVER